ncbi:hypothetical protein EVAR_29362_1 [Eumeta japonica]|uniref:Uncharacterized protein n=1 Tax=Eumeta variegata TaxID=151549 RepID=A0A4C1WHS3_EUMVA|nr:hypothetical protein EVAR_29362_1 [Eumeta japonica]
MKPAAGKPHYAAGRPGFRSRRCASFIKSTPIDERRNRPRHKPPNGVSCNTARTRVVFLYKTESSFRSVKTRPSSRARRAGAPAALAAVNGMRSATGEVRRSSNKGSRRGRTAGRTGRLPARRSKAEILDTLKAVRFPLQRADK